MAESQSWNPEAYSLAFQRDGYSVHPEGLSADEVESLRAAITAIPDGEAVRQKRGVYGVRHLLEICPAIRELAAHPIVRRFPEAVLGAHAFAVRAIFFDKIADANWAIFWHQDNVITVRDRIDAPGFRGWSRKAGVWQVQPPAEILSRMITVRVHLDDCGPDNGPLRVLPGSHRFGWLDDELNEWKSRVPEVVCVVPCGGMVTMSPLTLHASAASLVGVHRRVIHLEFAATDLPHGLVWNHRLMPGGQ